MTRGKEVTREHLSELCDQLIPPNSIVEAKVTKVHYSESSKITKIETKLTNYKAMAHSGKYLYQPYKRHASLYEDGGKNQKCALLFGAFRNQATNLDKNRSIIFQT